MATNTTTNGAYCDANELTTYLGLKGRRQLRKLMDAGLPFMRLGERSQLFKINEVDEWLDTRRVA